MPHDPADVAMWYDAFANEFFDDAAKLTMRNCVDAGAVMAGLVPPSTASDAAEHKTFVLGRALIPRFWRSFGEGGSTDLQLLFSGRSQVSIPHKNHMTHTQSVIYETEFCTLVCIIFFNMFFFIQEMVYKAEKHI